MRARTIAVSGLSQRRARPWALALALVALVTAAVTLLVVAPLWLSAAIVLAAVVAWCVWLDRHPELPDQ